MIKVYMKGELDRVRNEPSGHLSGLLDESVDQMLFERPLERFTAAVAVRSPQVEKTVITKCNDGVGAATVSQQLVHILRQSGQ